MISAGKIGDDTYETKNELVEGPHKFGLTNVRE